MVLQARQGIAALAKRAVMGVDSQVQFLLCLRGQRFHALHDLHSGQSLLRSKASVAIRVKHLERDLVCSKCSSNECTFPARCQRKGLAQDSLHSDEYNCGKGFSRHVIPPAMQGINAEGTNRVYYEVHRGSAGL